MRKLSVSFALLLSALNLVYESVINRFIADNVPLFGSLSKFLKEYLHLHALGIFFDLLLLIIGISLLIYGCFSNNYNRKNILESGLFLIIGFFVCWFITKTLAPTPIPFQ